MNKNERVVLLGPRGGSTVRIVYQALQRDLEMDRVILENPQARRALVVRRVRKLGVPTVVGQLLFQKVVFPIVRLSARNRMREIARQHCLLDRPIPEEKVVRVESVNSDQVRQELRRLRPAVVVVAGTPIISEKTLKAVESTFINMHAGITPRFRGVHGGYWALAAGEPENCGVTVHLVDKGIDTGGILYQCNIEPTDKDNFATYPLLQIAAGLPLLRKAIDDALQGRIAVFPPRDTRSHLWYHPTLWAYLGNRLRLGVK